MTHEEAFLEDILEQPDDDAPRLIFADWLEENGDPDRAEFIRIRVEQAHGPSARAKRAARLIEDNWDRWVKPLCLLADDTALRHHRWLNSRPRVSASKLVHEFPRGFIPSFALRASTFLAKTDAILALTALTRLRLDQAGGLGGALAACPALRAIRELEFIDWSHSPLASVDMAELAHSPHLTRLTTLCLPRNNLGDEGSQLLARAAWVSSIRSLDLSDNGLSTTGLRALTTRDDWHQLRELRLDNNFFDNEAVSLLLSAPWLRDLEILSLCNAGITDEQAQAISRRVPRVRLRLRPGLLG